jgi:hypothetical protein
LDDVAQVLLLDYVLLLAVVFLVLFEGLLRGRGVQVGGVCSAAVRDDVVDDGRYWIIFHYKYY